MKAWIIIAVVLSVVVGMAVFQLSAPVREGGNWGLATAVWGVLSIAITIGAWLQARRDPAALQLAAAAALLSVATITSGAMAAAHVRLQADFASEAVRELRSHEPSADAQDIAIDTAYVRDAAAPTARIHAALGLAGVLPLAAALALLARVMKSRRGRPEPERNAARLWLVLAAAGGVGATAAAAQAALAPVPVTQDPESSRQTLMERRFNEGDVPGACRLLESRLQSAGDDADRIPDVKARSQRCVDFEVARARRLGPDACETVLGMLEPMRFVRVAGRDELTSSCRDEGK